MYHLTVEILLDGKIMLTAGYVKGVDVVGSLFEFVSICNNWEPGRLFAQSLMLELRY